MANYKHSDPDFGRVSPAWLRGEVPFDESSGAEEMTLATWVMGKEGDFTAPTAISLGMHAGYVLLRHGHPCYRFEVIVQGSLHLEDGTVLEAGDVMTALPDELYGPHTAGPQGCTTIEVFSQLEGMYLMVTEEPDGTKRIWDARKGEMPAAFDPNITSTVA